MMPRQQGVVMTSRMDQGGYDIFARAEGGAFLNSEISLLEAMIELSG